MKFLQHAFEWYQRGKLSHAWSAVSRPWELGFKDLVDDIAHHSKRIDQRTGTASQAELRATHLETRQMRDELKETRVQVQQILQIALRKFNDGLV